MDDLKKQGRRGSKKGGGGGGGRREGRMAGNDGPSFPDVSDARFSSMHNAPVSRDTER